MVLGESEAIGWEGIIVESLRRNNLGGRIGRHRRIVIRRWYVIVWRKSGKESRDFGWRAKAG